VDERENAAYWEETARAWAPLSRDLVNSPAFFAMLPSVSGLRGIDVGCGEGHNTRLLSERARAR
jgi:hypothetical protein